MVKKKLTPLQALANAKQFCAYQERCHNETKDKLYSHGLATNDVEQIISQLIEEDYLNEERFAAAFARGKFRMKQWGRVKIRYEMKQRRITDYCIKKAMKEIDEEEYIKTLSKLKEEKLRTLKSEKNIFTKKKKLTDYLTQKGYERDIIFSVLKSEED